MRSRFLGDGPGERKGVFEHLAPERAGQVFTRAADGGGGADVGGGRHDGEIGGSGDEGSG
ncbi:MAG: hypothetical protein F4081_01565 [Dehalococcoidia bacterium]|nr:hypothetical protein [Dehalococcoidia bacterium]MYI85489.1 hypothetical protein [Dehalococcoidia bacterium]